jgi:hypothetical protein
MRFGDLCEAMLSVVDGYSVADIDVLSITDNRY